MIYGTIPRHNGKFPTAKNRADLNKHRTAIFEKKKLHGCKCFRVSNANTSKRLSARILANNMANFQYVRTYICMCGESFITWGVRQ